MKTRKETEHRMPYIALENSKRKHEGEEKHVPPPPPHVPTFNVSTCFDIPQNISVWTGLISQRVEFNGENFLIWHLFIGL
jgi:hypothetical protein